MNIGINEALDLFHLNFVIYFSSTKLQLFKLTVHDVDISQ